VTELDPFERLKILESQTYNKRYFYYDPASGTVLKIHNHVADEPYPFVEMSIEELPDNFSSLNLDDFSVTKSGGKIDIVTKKIEATKIDGSIPTLYVSSKNVLDRKADLLIEQDNLIKQFVLSLSEDAKDYYRRNGSSLSFIFFVTLENDPSILYTSFMAPFSELLDKESVIVPFGTYDGSRANLYTVRFFNTYLHVVYDEDKST
jgi:hypothetical protein